MSLNFKPEWAKNPWSKINRSEKVNELSLRVKTKKPNKDHLPLARHGHPPKRTRRKWRFSRLLRFQDSHFSPEQAIENKIFQGRYSSIAPGSVILFYTAVILWAVVILSSVSDIINTLAYLRLHIQVWRKRLLIICCRNCEFHWFLGSIWLSTLCWWKIVWRFGT